jgi:putative spermidine/putrescine transport system ATP-binding protein
VVEPRVLLLDEPLSNLDAKIRQRLRVEVRRLQRRVGITTIYVTHDQEEALAIADRVVLMNRGAVVQAGTPEEVYLAPATEFVADFLGVGNRVEGRAEPGAVHVEGQRLPYGGAARGAVLVILRSSDLGLAPPAAGTGDRSDEPRLAGQLEESLFLGAYYRHYVRVGEAVLMVDGPAPARPGPVTITVPPDRVRVYPAA